MRLSEIEKPKYTLYIDMDGVLVDFEKSAHKLLGEPITATNKKIYWKKLQSLGENGALEFWTSMDWMPNGKKLWNFCSQFNPIILSSPGHTMRTLIEKGKEVWIQKNMSPKPGKVLFETDKEKYANPKAIIIDDRSKVIDPWRSAGGIGIHYQDKNIDNVIAELTGYFNS
jgi:hypothetical protein